jgi:hypothetical protein
MSMDIAKHIKEHAVLGIKKKYQTGAQQVLPIGTVLMYNGTGIADVETRTEDIGERTGDSISLLGWKVCNGLAGTPNLLNKFIRSMSASGNTGGSDDAMAHTHAFTQPSAHEITQPTFNTPTLSHAAHSHGSSNMFACINAFDTANYTRWIGRGSFASTSVVACEIWAGGSNATVGGVAISGNTDSTTDSSHAAAACTRTTDVALTNNHSGGAVGAVNESRTGQNMPAYYSLIFIIRMS